MAAGLSISHDKFKLFSILFDQSVSQKLDTKELESTLFSDG